MSDLRYTATCVVKITGASGCLRTTGKGDSTWCIDAARQTPSDITRELIVQALTALDKSTPDVTGD